MYLYTVFERPDESRWTDRTAVHECPVAVEGFFDPERAAEFIDGQHRHYFIVPIWVVDSEPECEYPACDCEDECKVTGVGIDVEENQTSDLNAFSGELLETSSLPTFKAKTIHVHYHS